MSTVDPARVNSFLKTVDSELVPQIEASGDRLTRNNRLLNKYRSERDAWHNRRVSHVRGITEAVNELCFADLILKDKKVEAAEYEPPIRGTNRTIDFLVLPAGSDGRIYYDIKTVHPEEEDGWERYERAKTEKRFTPGTELILDPEWEGGEIAHDLFAAREKFLEYTQEFETKIQLVENPEECRFGMVFCGDGSQWYRDNLEDFADFYFTGRHRSDDEFGAMEAHYLTNKGITLDRTINGFSYLQRAKPRINVVFNRNVRGPRRFSPQA
ncbi:MAG: hypothetical protein O2807_04210 [bacterium]|nr:hypothetical protein [bacterium]